MSTIVLNVLLSLFLGIAMKQIWSLLNTLQILTHISLLGAPIPANLLMTLELIIEISNLNIIPSSVTDYVFGSISN